jgi:hypothetical protein
MADIDGSYAEQRETRASEGPRLRKPPIVTADRAPLSLIVYALVIGLLLGLLAPVTSQEGLDGSLVLAGIVHYPAQSPMNQYFLDSWTIIHQLGALLLRAGLDQAHLSELIFLVPCALLVCAYAAIIYCFSGQFLLSLLAAPLCYLANPLAKLFVSSDYMALGLLWSQPPEQTFGFWAQVGAVWVIGCVAAGRNALAGFSALVLIAVHPVLGTYMVVLLIGTLVVGRFLFALDMRGLAKGAALGACITLVSLAIFLETRAPPGGETDPVAYNAYMSFWDVHRSHVMTLSIAMRIAAAAAIAIAALSAFLVLAYPRRNAAVLACVLVLLAVTASTIAYYAVHLVPDLLPGLFVRAAPGRLLNVQAYLSTPIALGLALYVADHATKHVTKDAKAGAAAGLGRMLPIAVLLLVIVSAITYALPRRHLIVDLMHTILETRILGNPSQESQDKARFWREVRNAGIAGLVLTSRATSRPTLDDGHLPTALNVGSFDFIPYVPQTAGPVAHIIQEGYGISFADPPADLQHGGGLPPDGGKDYWAQLRPGDWCQMSRSLGIAAIVAPSGWIVKLPPLVSGTSFTLYRIPCS